MTQSIRTAVNIIEIRSCNRKPEQTKGVTKNIETNAEQLYWSRPIRSVYVRVPNRIHLLLMIFS